MQTLISWSKKLEKNHVLIAVSVLYLSIALCKLFLTNYFLMLNEQQFVLLADSFLHGKTYFTSIPSYAMGFGDTSFHNGHYYWPLGIFPALLLMPFVGLFGTGFMQGYISFPLVIATGFFLYKILKTISGKKFVSLVLALAFIFCTAYIKVALFPYSWYFAHVVSVACLAVSLYFTLVKQKPALAGIFFSFAFLTRISIILGIVFYILYYFFYYRETFFKKIVYFLIPVVFGIGIFFVYNYVRFGNIFETGYATQILPVELSHNRDLGMWSITHFPQNLSIFLFRAPDNVPNSTFALFNNISPNRWGMSFVFTSPILLYLFAADLKNKLNRIAIFSSLIISVFLFGSFGLGGYQYGYRFALDFQLFLFLVLADVFRKRELNFYSYAVLVGSYFFNSYMAMRSFS